MQHSTQTRIAYDVPGFLQCKEEDAVLAGVVADSQRTSLFRCCLPLAWCLTMLDHEVPGVL